jgi:hypothetical protein
MDRKMSDLSKITKAIVSVAEMARMVGLSRARFYQLQKAGIFPQPGRDPETKRPYYTEELQNFCLEVRRRNFGINGKPILFYAKRTLVAPSPRKLKAPKKQDRHTDLINSLQSLGLTSMTNAQVGSAIKELYPQGMKGLDQAEVIRSVFLYLRRKNTSDNVEK